MRPDDADRSYLLDMLRYARGISASLQEVAYDEFERDENLRLATERRIEIIGEAARRVSRTFQGAHSHVPWQKIVAQRHVLAHEYGEIESELIWRVATVHVPELVTALEAMLAEP